ncbi:MAG: tetratricopeptide repeat protein [Spirochaetaceae bacterium]|jgi:tetratricopeptide (TPR) repeat protein|nr:tetratricopeptide repeat protein [Spirochaetaceae bacterium]
MNRTADLHRIVFLSVPESLRGQIESEETGSGKTFSIDPAIPIPVELAPGETDLDLEQLSWEMILSGMIRVIGENPDGEDADYYRRFVLSVKPAILRELTEAALLKAGNGDYDLALEILDALSGLFPHTPEVLLNRALVRENRADALARSGREDEAERENAAAEEVYQRVLSLNPPYPNGLFNAAFFFMKRRCFARARDCFSAYIPLADNPEKREKAGALLREIEIHGLDDEEFRDAYDFISRGEEEAGLLLIRSFLERHYDVWNGWFLLGWALRRLGRWADGAASFGKALELGGDTSDTRNELAICLMELGDYRAARRELEAALRTDPENSKIISNLGVLALKSGDNGEAAGFFRTVLELTPGDPLAKEYLDRLEA